MAPADDGAANLRDMAALLTPEQRAAIEQIAAGDPGGRIEQIAVLRRYLAELDPCSRAEQDVLGERRRQVEAEGFDPAHDDRHNTGELARAAACYCLGLPVNEPDRVTGRHALSIWPWALAWWKPRSRRENLVRAGALVIAEIERIDRAAARNAEPPCDESRPDFRAHQQAGC